jgi:isocitrate/isopropylmalate dehydrogenase
MKLSRFMAAAPDIAGKGIANPTAMILAATMMLRHISERKAAKAISDAPGRVLAQGECLTRDLGGRATTAQFGDAVMRELDRSGATRS